MCAEWKKLYKIQEKFNKSYKSDIETGTQKCVSIWVPDTQIKNIPMPEVVDLKAAGYIKSQIHGIAVDWPKMYPPCFAMPIFGIRVGVYHHIGSFCVPAATQSGGKERQGL